ncbi:MAG: DNA-processing protein DprA [Planctomycetota bacterium]
MGKDIRRLCPRDRTWPEALRSIEAPPEALWLRGDTHLLERRPRVAIVGTRAPSPYGVAQAERFAAAFVAAGACVVSGLARGVDAAAHRSALAFGGATIAVLACGVDRPWPAGPLAEQMATEGLLLSELEPGTPPSKARFPLRNRLISGLSDAVVVIEAAYRSGSLITARWAADQGRDVWALPGRVDQPMAAGCHRLLRDGAALVEEPAEVLGSLGLTADVDVGPAVPDDLEPGLRAILDALVGETSSAHEIAKRSTRLLPAVLADLARLELEGLVARAPGGLYRRVSARC